MKQENQKQFAEIHFKHLEVIIKDSISTRAKYFRLKEMLERICNQLLFEEPVEFSNLFSKLVYVSKKYKVSGDISKVRYAISQITNRKQQASDELFSSHINYFANFIAEVFKVSIPDTLKEILPKNEIKREPKREETAEFLSKIRAVVIEKSNGFLWCEIEKESEEKAMVKVYPNAIFSTKDFWKGAQVYLVNIRIDNEGSYFPRFIILEPDYLLDISAIAECFQDYGFSALHFLKSKFEEVPNNKHIRLGNFANLIVDELITENGTEKQFNTIFYKDFTNYPFEYTTSEDIKEREDFKEYYESAKKHFSTIKRVIQEDFKKLEIDRNRVTLEPSFFSDLYGIQGRLDILDLEDDKNAKIVELKSGSTPFPDDGRTIKRNHVVQLFLYYQIIGVLNKLRFNEISTKINGYILYSKSNLNNIRSEEPTLDVMQRIFNLRNEIIVNEHKLANDAETFPEKIIKQINSKNLIQKKNLNPRFKDILIEQIREFQQPIEKLSETEKAYFNSFVSFIAKEQYLAKIGNADIESNRGLASVWLSSFDEKEAKFEILYDLEIEENNVANSKKEIVLTRTNAKNKYANFREGDMCILYPRNENEFATDSQIFKCTVKSISSEKVVLGFRYTQHNTKFFDSHKKWALEKDSMDSSFKNMYKNLYMLLHKNTDDTIQKVEKRTQKRRKILTLLPPEQENSKEFHKSYLSVEQNRILKKAINTNDYFLLNGPPGTGKTSIIIKELVEAFYKEPNSNILLLAYTNRAVDELCETVNTALREVGEKENTFVRIGNELSCQEEFRGSLLKNITEKATKREEIETKLKTHRIYVSTVASISGKLDLFKLKKFDTLIIDEASQILEPQIVGLLPEFERFIMIGDHKQLPAIVLQNEEQSKTNNLLLEKIGLQNRKNSLFERLYLYCEKNGFDFAYDQLTFQGRMHEDIAAFPNKEFYDGKLNQAFHISTLTPEAKQNLQRQVLPLNLKTKSNSELEKYLATKRMLFFSCKNDSNKSGKQNEKEADYVVSIVQKIHEIYAENNLEIDAKKTIGIIAPFRSQLATIKQKLEQAKIPNHQNITVDTVERYQGSQRDIIIYSFTVNEAYQLKAIENYNDDKTVDRKLNVALTRAKEQMIMVGNETVICQNSIFSKLIDFTSKYGGFV
ncbi:AAA domain-containing protein [Aureivirga sp. CE67]|uniref:AAA domain-containing protein n=1 Tax=Aureivirga sp. CE67 TaxID=1788983 RepID=UPI0018CA708F|nr:AAA domain-containing protein [Aureivirga sp. CE67]